MLFLSPSQRIYVQSVVIGSNVSASSFGIGIHFLSASTRATLCSRNKSAKRSFSHCLFRISTASLYPLGVFLRSAFSRDKNCTGVRPVLKYGNWSIIAPSLPFKTLIVCTNCSNSPSQSTRTFSCVIVCGTFTEKIKSSGVFCAQPFMVLGDGQA